LQLFVAVDGNVVVAAFTAPLIGATGAPQSTGVHFGDVPLQPFDWQARVALPTRRYPASQEYVAVEPTTSFAATTVPFIGSGRAGQSAGTHDGSEPLQVPSARQVRVEDPEAPYPIEQA
jgi:hypothetical protein